MRWYGFGGAPHHRPVCRRSATVRTGGTAAGLSERIGTRTTLEIGVRTRDAEARDEERRTLRRDLHDGLGPTLAGVSLGVQ
ncbi:hypothetical protein AB0K04_23155, partial [Micromonospora coxensis]|uniref:hypothetical protein n=1 Tax=Micromonospora coxensis TaxID=356852 RepID=UPI0034325158